MKKFVVFFVTLFIVSHSVAKAPIFCNGRIFKIKSFNNKFRLCVIPDRYYNPKFAIIEITTKEKNQLLYLFKTNYGPDIDYVVSETGETVLQILSFTLVSKNSKGSREYLPYSEIKVFRNGKLTNIFKLDFVFCTFSFKNKYQKEITNIDESKFLNLVSDTLYVISDNKIYGININDGNAIPITNKDFELKSYKYKWKRLRDWHLRKYKKYDLLLKQSEGNVPHATF